MASNYQAIRKENERLYGTDIGRFGQLLLANRYDDRTHFIYELLQNAEDALARRDGWTGQRSIRFGLSERELRVSHFGKPFDEADVRGICGIDESTKDITRIGRFGIGFKSVYAFTDRPEVHSGDENFGIESFVWPVAVPRIQRETNETIIVLPLRAPAGSGEIAAGLKRLGVNALLFLREIEEIQWNVDDGLSGLYLRQSDNLEDCVRRVTVIGQADGQPDAEQTWLVFSKAMHTSKDELVGHVEVAFSLEHGRVRPVPRSPLVVYFPTVVETSLGFRVQGPYRTTPSRDNVPHRDSWNQECVRATAVLLVNALTWLRDLKLLDVHVLQCLPIDQKRFDEDSMFAPLYEVTKQALVSQRLLPRFGGGHVAAGNAKLARTQELRELFESEQLAQLFSVGGKLAWLSGDISHERTPELRRYLMDDLQVVEVTPGRILPRLNAAFLEEQNDEWVRRLYEFLNSQTALRREAANLPLVRLTDGTHVQACTNGRLQAFLPGEAETDFPTVRAAVCDSDDARAFLGTLGLTEPDPVDDVVRNVLHKYGNPHDVGDDEYDADIRRILNAFKTDSRDQRNKLVKALCEAPFIRAVDTGDGSRCCTRPGDLYLATDRLKKLFAGIESIKLVDDGCAALRGEDVRTLLEACGATRHLQKQGVECQLSSEELREIRRQAGLERNTWGRPTDATLRGIDPVLNSLADVGTETQQLRSNLIWEALVDLADRNPTAFQGKYTWGYAHEQKTVNFDAAFVRHLNETAWIPDGKGKLQRPDLVLFESLDWTPDPFLQSRIHFKLPIISQLAEEAGFEPAMLDRLKSLGITSEAELIAQLRLPETAISEGGSDGPTTPDEAIAALLGGTPNPTPPVADPHGVRGVLSGTTSGRTGTFPDGGRAGATGGYGGSEREGLSGGSGRGRARGTSGVGRERSFISYVAVHHDDDKPDPDGLEQAARMALEDKAVDFILNRYPNWKRAPTHNPGFDLFESGLDGNSVRWCEVKAMTGSLDDRPVGLSRRQFDCACKHGANYWLYVVECAGDETARLIRIQDPAGKARTFAFDRGWRDIAEVDSEPETEFN